MAIKTKPLAKPKAAAKAAKIRRLVQQHLASRARGRAAYAEADKALNELIRLMPPGERINLPGRRQAELVDLFRGKNKVFKSQGIGRFEVEVINL